MDAILPLIVILPLLGSAIIGLAGFLRPGFRKQESLIGIIATLAVAVPFVLLALVFAGYDGTPVMIELFSWMKAGKLEVNFNYQLDELSLMMGMIVTGVGSLIHIYSIGYMHGDEGYYKYFAYLNLFIFAMINLVLADNMVVMFLGWEGVGLCSYLLIGFWYQDMMKAVAAQKAFIANRIGDFALVVAMFLLFRQLGSLEFSAINSQVTLLEDNIFWIGLLVFIAATGKSAQIPLFVWLPDAMAGPTPVSALIHAATMVTAGVYLIARIHPVFTASPEVLLIIVIIACLTALIAALIAISQNDIKKVLAYSTVSQLGFMFMALGAGAYTTALFHVMTHAFFKACLFLGSGSVIHAMEHMKTVDDPQDIRTMGGLQKHMPQTARTFWISNLAIAGIPLLSGFFSKDEILASLFFFGYKVPLYWVIWGVALLTSVLTAFYMTRLTYLTFNGLERYPKTVQPHESPAVMTIPLWILAILAIFGGYIGLPYLFGEGEFHLLEKAWLGNVIQNVDLHELMHEHHVMEYVLLGLAVLTSVGTVFFTYRFYAANSISGDKKVRRTLGGLYKVMEGKFYFDELYQRILIRPFMWLGEKVMAWIETNIIDGFVNGTADTVSGMGDVFKRLQTGLVQNYILVVSLGVVGLLAYLIFA